MCKICSLKPERLWHYFNEISKIPRTSLDEERVIDYIAGIADGLGLDNKRDSVNNLIVYKKAKKENRDKKILTLQSHVDMVGVRSSGSNHDFGRDPIDIFYEDGYVKARETTLGADNGIGVALMMAFMEEDFDCVDLEFLFTINEESGMTGARNLKEDFLRGRLLLNLDSEEWGCIYVSCAGASDSVITFSKGENASYDGYISAQLCIDNLLGGHSGIEIHSGKRNANKLLARVLRALSKVADISVQDISGGTKRNAIPASARALFAIRENAFEKAESIVSQYGQIFKDEFGEIEKNFSLSLKKNGSSGQKGLTVERTRQLINLLMALPNGVIAMSPSIEGLVETSTNLGVIESGEDAFTIRILSRSSIDTSVDELNDRINIITGLCGGKVELTPGYPGWKPNLQSALLNTAKEAYKSKYGQYPEIKAIHAGLETAIIGKKFDNMDMISIGPNLYHPHSPDEKVCVETVEKLYDFTREIIKSL